MPHSGSNVGDTASRFSAGEMKNVGKSGEPRLKTPQRSPLHITTVCRSVEKIFMALNPVNGSSRTHIPPPNDDRSESYHPPQAAGAVGKGNGRTYFILKMRGVSWSCNSPTAAQGSISRVFVIRNPFGLVSSGTTRTLVNDRKDSSNSSCSGSPNIGSRGRLQAMI